jgi:surface antigen
MSFVKPLFLIGLLLTLAACSSSFNTPYAAGHYESSPTQCVPYAREKSGVNLYGDAYSWWDQVDKTVYMRGNTPIVGSVLVLAQTSNMTHGHVAVVTRIVNSREISVTHSNWGNGWLSRRRVYEYQRVMDVSAMNDWTSVRFWNYEENTFGFPYAAKGFIYK